MFHSPWQICSRAALSMLGASSFYPLAYAYRLWYRCCFSVSCFLSYLRGLELAYLILASQKHICHLQCPYISDFHFFTLLHLVDSRFCYVYKHDYTRVCNSTRWKGDILILGYYPGLQKNHAWKFRAINPS